VRGQRGGDTLTADSGSDEERGGSGDDSIDGHDGQGGDKLNGGKGRDFCTADNGDRVRHCEA
jgi:Ca2+-binding RTX toxin-like protein